ncbi:bicaudal D-related protein homolog isoform X1 [Drosophila sulfurigaster albostrigata]|uniref:bicaudal D-related protein homolog isoform X1 n=1 Tax=Drosophila nasuta TaxID=42062 RepID=UPI00295E6469|nr:bicaudal D-related protein homolog isoform X1 [Drosophila nasuta]XP_062130899.1 bicaudal D-related protein homolog isoform X1 [Drosophila sulfurigaster albostrigata]XP_062130901.1 bicaudal D-related protein homolog isoform X1 [Drosophila sulfurigaster albostrigata]
MHRPKLANPITAAGIASSISNKNNNSNNNKSKRSRQFSISKQPTTTNESATVSSSTLPHYEQHSNSHSHSQSQLIDASIDLEHYISAMEARRNDNEPDVWAQLQQKESDILLAAELGKALLEKNEELVKQQEKLIEDYSGKIEKLEQEKHVLRQKLAIAEDESDQRVLELQSDLNELKDKLQTQDAAIRQAEKEKTILIDELQHQNTRLTEQIQEAHATEMKLSAQIQELKDQYHYRNSSLQEHVNSLESIKTELNLTTGKRQELERRLQHAQEEKESLTSSLEEASDRIHMLERHAREQETKLETTLQALERSQRENNVLSERLGADTNSMPGKKSLQFEMECDEEEASFTETGKPSQMWIEARSVYIQLKSLVDSLKVSHDDDSGLNSDISLDLESMDNTMSSTDRSEGDHIAIEFRQGMLSAMSDELTRLLLNLDAGNFKKMLDQTRNLVLEQEDEIKRSHQLIQQLEAKVTVTDVELQNVKEERDQARGDLVDNTDRDELLTKAQKERDAANERRTKAEVELAKNRVELMQANSQLLESIQQKVELSQQLEQWQMDMQELIDEQMRSKLINNRRVASSETTSAPPSSAAANLAKRVSSYKLWSLFQR